MSEITIRTAIDAFLADWNRGGWMAENGTWESDAPEWVTARDAYADARSDLEAEMQGLSCAEDVRSADRARDVLRAAKALVDAAAALEDQPTGDRDYIAEGVIDPDGVAESAEDLEIGDRWQGWDCTESWGAYRVLDALYIRWCRDACGHRRHRDLWVRVAREFFAD